ncbi:MAG: glycosyltransferase, partial [Nevskiales bacterium]
MSITLLLGLIFGYYLCLHGIYLLLILIGTTQLRRYHLGLSFGEFKRIADSPLTLPFTVIIPAYNEEKIIISAVLGALNLRYPQHEVIVVNDGSPDQTLPLLIKHFGLHRVHKVGQTRFKTRTVRGIYESLEFPKLIVIDKDNGHRADAINAAVNYSRYPILCIMDADCVFEEDALLRVIRPF